MFKPDRHHIIIAVKTLAVQALLFCSILLVVWGSQKLYGLIDQTRFPVPYQVTVTEGMTDEQKGKELIDALTARMRYELNSTFAGAPTTSCSTLCAGQPRVPPVRHLLRHQDTA